MSRCDAQKQRKLFVVPASAGISRSLAIPAKAGTTNYFLRSRS